MTDPGRSMRGADRLPPTLRAARLRERNGVAVVAPAPWGAVRGLLPGELRQAGVAGLLVGALELALRPGVEVVATLGGVGQLAGGLFTVGEPGLAALLGEGGLPPARLLHVGEAVRYRNGLDGAEGDLTPEGAIAAQRQLGVSLVIAPTLPERIVVNGRERRVPLPLAEDWLRRGAVAVREVPALALIPAGSPSYQRHLLAVALAERFTGVAVVGALERREWPSDWTWLSLGLRTVREVDRAVARGADVVVPTFPTALARGGRALVGDGIKVVADYPEETGVLDAGCGCPACRVAVGYLAHLVRAKEILGELLLLLHNLRTVVRRVAGVTLSAVDC